MALQVPFVRFDYERQPRHSNQNGSFYYVSTGGGLRENIGRSIDRGRGHFVYRRDYNFVRTYAAEFPLGTIDYFVVEYQSADSEHLLKRSRPFGMSDEVVTNLPVNILPVGYAAQVHGQSSYSSDDLPKAVVMTLNQGSVVKSMDFHPVQQILLLVGTNTREITLWELGSRKRLAVRNFKASLANDYTAPINRVIWSPDGTLFGVAYSKHIVHIYSYHGGDDVRNHLEIEAHGGSVNDLAFSYPNKQLSIVTCGDDRAIKVWDAVTGIKQYTFEGHEAPVYSVCTHHKENIQFIFSTATDGKIKAWLYDNLGSRVDYNAPGHSATTMAYSADGTSLRLVSDSTKKGYCGLFQQMTMVSKF